MEKRTFTQQETEQSLFIHKFNAKGVEQGNLAIVQSYDDGYVKVARIVGGGISLPLLTAWSGCLYPSMHTMNKDQLKAVREVRKVADIVATQPIGK